MEQGEIILYQPIYEHKDGLSVVPSCLDLSAVETELINEAGRELILAHLSRAKRRNSIIS